MILRKCKRIGSYVRRWLLRVAPDAQGGESSAAELVQRKRADDSTRPDWDSHDRLVEQYAKEYAEQDAFDRIQLARQHEDEVLHFKVALSGPEIPSDRTIPAFVIGKIETSKYKPGDEVGGYGSH